MYSLHLIQGPRCNLLLTDRVEARRLPEQNPKLIGGICRQINITHKPVTLFKFPQAKKLVARVIFTRCLPPSAKPESNSPLIISHLVFSYQPTKMCISVFLWASHPLYPFILLLNRDEYHDRPTEPLYWWEGGNILGGRDLTAGGTWLASSRQGKVAFVTNVRELKSTSAAAKSRGDLPVRFLQSDKSPMEFAEEIVKEAFEYNGFNLLIADLLSMNMVYVTNRLKGEDSCFVTSVPRGVHVVTNASLNTPWPKAQRLERGFKDLLDKYRESEIPINEFVDKLMGNTVKDDISKLPQIYAPEVEYQLSSVFVDMIGGIQRRYGTRSTSALALKVSGEVFFYEKHLENDLWKEKSHTYMIQKDSE